MTTVFNNNTANDDHLVDKLTSGVGAKWSSIPYDALYNLFIPEAVDTLLITSPTDGFQEIYRTGEEFELLEVSSGVHITDGPYKPVHAKVWYRRLVNEGILKWDGDFIDFTEKGKRARYTFLSRRETSSCGLGEN